MKKGIFYAVGVGAGDPLDMTIKAKKILEESDAIVMPVKKSGEKSIAYDIALRGTQISHIHTIEVVFPMKKSADYRKYLYYENLKEIFRYLDNGKQVSVVTLGDVSVYSTAEYLREYIDSMGYETYVCAGISSFSASAAKAKISLCENKESFSVVPAVTDKNELVKKLSDFDTLVIMKAGNSLSWIIEYLKENNLYQNTMMFCNLGMEGEYIGPAVTDVKSYFTTLIIKQKN